jgi:hypothetical protein
MLFYITVPICYNIIIIIIIATMFSCLESKLYLLKEISYHSSLSCLCEFLFTIHLSLNIKKLKYHIKQIYMQVCCIIMLLYMSISIDYSTVKYLNKTS